MGGLVVWWLPSLPAHRSASPSYTHTQDQFAQPRALREALGDDVEQHGLRVDVKYNLRKQWYTAVNNTNGELTYNKDDGRWDLAIDYRFRRRYELYVNWRNLSGSVASTYIGNRKLNYTTSGSLINVGVRRDL